MKSIRKLLSLLLTVVLLIGLTACGNTTKENSNKEQDVETKQEDSLNIEPVKLIANSTANPGTAEVIALETFKKNIEDATDGLITVEIYTSGTLFTADGENAALANGDIDMCITSFDWFAESGSPWISMFNAPYLFDSYETASKVLNGNVGQQAFEKIYNEQHIKILAPAYIGTRQLIMRNDVNVQTTADLKGVLLRVPNTATYVAMAKAMGAAATPMALDEVYLALQTGAIDAIEVPLNVMNTRKFYEVCKTLVLTNHLVNMKVIAINGDTWDSFSPEVQEMIIEAAKAGGLACDNTILGEEEKLIDVMKNNGLNVITPDVSEFQKTVLDAFISDESITSDWDMDMYNAIIGK